MREPKKGRFCQLFLGEKNKRQGNGLLHTFSEMPELEKETNFNGNVTKWRLYVGFNERGRHGRVQLAGVI